MSSLLRVRKCGRVRRADHVGVRMGEAGAGFSGLCSCGSVWACPVCNAKIMWHRFMDVGAGLATHYERGGSVLFMTRTIRHHRGEALVDLWSDVSSAWRSMTSSAGWKRQVLRLGVVGVIRVVEVTDGANGWHVHVHALLLTATPLNESTITDFAIWSSDAWARAVVRRGRPAPLAVGQDVRQMITVGEALAAYVTKMALEVTASQSKLARSAYSTTPVWRLAAEAANGEELPVLRWHEWEAASKGRRQMTWSRGLRVNLGLVLPEKTDEEAADEGPLGDDDLLWITGRGWETVVRTPGLQGQILTAAEAGSVALRALLLEHEVEWVETVGAEITAEALVAVLHAAPVEADTADGDGAHLPWRKKTHRPFARKVLPRGLPHVQPPLPLEGSP